MERYIERDRESWKEIETERDSETLREKKSERDGYR